LGFMGGLGNDPNSMIPLLLLIAAGYLAVTRPAAAGSLATAAADGTASWPGRLTSVFASASATGLLAFWAAALVVLGAAPMAMAQANSNADPIIAQAIDGSSAPVDLPAAPFRLTDQNGRPVSLASLRGKVVLLTFLDPVCTTDCPLIAQELRVADQMLGPAAARHLVIVAVAANPLYHSQSYVREFSRQEHVDTVPNWRFLTGPLPALRRVWSRYGITVQVLPGSQMVGHNDLVFALDTAGRIRFELNSDPGAGTVSTKSSFAAEFAQVVRRTLALSGPQN
ncbi:MAG TPA: SCO family protein, partial [Streptosporangiaceae bacterium]